MSSYYEDSNQVAVLRERIAELARIRQGFAAHLGASLYEATKADDTLRWGRESLYDGIAMCDNERARLLARIAELEQQTNAPAAPAAAPTEEAVVEAPHEEELFEGTSAEEHDEHVEDASEATPISKPVFDLEPEPDFEPTYVLEPEPEPAFALEPEPAYGSDSVLEPEPAYGSAFALEPEPEPALALEPEPEPEPAPVVAPDETPAPEFEPSHGFSLNDVFAQPEPEPEPAYVPTYEPAPVEHKVAAPVFSHAEVSQPAARTSAIKCPRCGAIARDGDKFCMECGARLSIPAPAPAHVETHEEKPAICPECGSPVDPSFKFCMTCGHKL